MMEKDRASAKIPFVRMVKRDAISAGKAWGIRLLAVLLSLALCAAVIVPITGQNPLQIYASIIAGAVGNARRAWVTIRELLVLLIVAVGLTPAFRMRFWNVGAEGQILMGGLASAALMIYAGGKLPNAVLLCAIFIASALAGMLWGVLPGVFKAYFKTNETLFTLMMNYVAMQIITYCIVFWENPKGSNTVGIINQTSQAGWFPTIAKNPYLLNVIVVTLVTAAVSVYMRYSKQGYEICVVGESENTARYAGINVKRVIIRTMDTGSGAPEDVCRESDRLAVGIANTRKRLELLCNGSLEIHITPDGTTADIMIPIADRETA